MVLIGGVLFSILLPQALHKLAPAVVAPRNWWVGLGAALAGAGFYRVSLRRADEPVSRTARAAAGGGGRKRLKPWTRSASPTW